MPITKASGQAVAPAAKGDLVVGSATNDAAVLSVGSANQVLTVDSSTTTGLKWATPVSSTPSFTQRVALITQSFRTVEYNGTNLYVAAGGGGNLYTSPDGATWTARTSGFGANTIRKVAFGNGLWVAVGNNGTLTTSTDAITWTARTANMSTNVIYDVKYLNSTWIAVGAGGGATDTGGIIYSTDGITWTRKSQTPTIGTTYYSVAFNGTNFVVGADINTNNILYASTPSGTWTAVAAGTNGIRNVFYDGTRTVLVQTSGTMSYSTSSTIASVTDYSGTSCSSDSTYNYYYNGVVYSSQQAVQGYSTTPASNDAGIRNVFFLSPASYSDSAGALQYANGTIWVGAAGYMIASTFAGQLYTSF